MVPILCCKVYFQPEVRLPSPGRLPLQSSLLTSVFGALRYDYGLAPSLLGEPALAVIVDPQSPDGVRVTTVLEFTIWISIDGKGRGSGEGKLWPTQWGSRQNAGNLYIPFHPSQCKFYPRSFTTDYTCYRWLLAQHTVCFICSLRRILLISYQLAF